MSHVTEKMRDSELSFTLMGIKLILVEITYVIAMYALLVNHFP